MGDNLVSFKSIIKKNEILLGYRKRHQVKENKSHVKENKSHIKKDQSTCPTCNQCQCSKHEHREAIRDFSTIIDCATASVNKCEFGHCEKIICNGCYIKHIDAHLKRLEKNRHKLSQKSAGHSRY